MNNQRRDDTLLFKTKFTNWTKLYICKFTKVLLGSYLKISEEILGRETLVEDPFPKLHFSFMLGFSQKVKFLKMYNI